MREHINRRFHVSDPLTSTFDLSHLGRYRAAILFHEIPLLKYKAAREGLNPPTWSCAEPLTALIDFRISQLADQFELPANKFISILSYLGIFRLETATIHSKGIVFVLCLFWSIPWPTPSILCNPS